jgi:hypothetical protein
VQRDECQPCASALRGKWLEKMGESKKLKVNGTLFLQVTEIAFKRYGKKLYGGHLIDSSLSYRDSIITYAT